MASWKITLNEPHIRRVGRCLLLYAIYFVYGLVAGWHLKPRSDEIIFMVTLPLWVLLPYTVGCLAIVTVKALRPVRPQPGAWRWNRRRLAGDDSLRDKPGTDANSR